METFYLYGIVALIAACFKTLILRMVVTHNPLTSAFNPLCITFIIGNFLEFLIYFAWYTNQELSNFLGHILLLDYYFLGAFMVIFCSAVCKMPSHRAISRVVIFLASALTVLHLCGYITPAFENTGNRIVSKPGVLYILFPIYGMLCVSVCCMLLFSRLRSRDAEIKFLAKWTLLALAPIVAVVLAVGAGRILGYPTSTTMAMAIASTIFVGLLLLETNDKIITFSLKLNLHVALSRRCCTTDLDKNFVWFEEVHLKETMKQCGGNMSETARRLGRSPSWVSKKCDEFGIYQSKRKKKGKI